MRGPENALQKSAVPVIRTRGASNLSLDKQLSMAPESK